MITANFMLRGLSMIMLSTGGFYWDGLMNHQVRMMISRKVGQDYS